jgi:DNA-binding PucR family transcriptional regulator
LAFGSSFKTTLRVYIEENRLVEVTAARLHIHTNTLYVRLRKIEEILGLRLNNSEDWIKVYLACHLSNMN